MCNVKLKDWIAYGIVALAVILTAYNGNMDWMALVAVALIFKLPGTLWLRKILKMLGSK